MKLFSYLRNLATIVPKSGITILFLFQVLFCSAKQITKEQSLAIAKQFYSEQRTSKFFKVKSETIPDFKLDYIANDAPSAVAGKKLSPAADSVAYYYIYNVGDNQGFVIVSGDDRTKPILGYSDEGRFASDNMPAHIKEFMDNYKNQVKAIIQQNNANSYNKIVNAVNAVAPLINTKWGQDAPYNKSIKTMYGGKTTIAPTGCVATAMAQVMKYYNWPKSGAGSYLYAYPAGVNDGYQANFAQTTYDWANMLNEYNIAKDTAAINITAVSTLMFHAGVSVNMKYEASVSNSNVYKSCSALMSYFKYDKTIQHIVHANISDTEWQKLILDEINAGRPVILGGYSNDGGHAYIGDGYDNNQLIHINWGWDGYMNGYFETSSLDGVSSNIMFNKYQDMVIGIRKPKQISDYTLNYNYDYKAVSNGFNTPVAKNDIVKFSYSTWEGSGNAYSGLTGLGIFKNDSLLMVIDSSKLINVYPSLTFQINNKIPKGNYQLIPVYKSNKDSFWSVCCYVESTSSMVENIELEVSDNDIKFYWNSKFITCKTPGALIAHISDRESGVLGRITVSGNIDQGDILRLRDLQNVPSIDLQNANIVKTEIAMKGDAINPIKVNVINEKSLIRTAFANSWMVNIVLPPNLKEIGKLAFTYSQMRSITIPDSITVIQDSTFRRCDYLNTVNFPRGLLSIGVDAFDGCSGIKILNLPENLLTINNGAFRFSSACALSDINSYNPIPPSIIGTAFLVPNATVLHVPIGSKSRYKAAVGWKAFANILEDLPVNVTKVIFNPTAGLLSSQFTKAEKISTNNLIISGNLNALDCTFLRDSISSLLSLDISNCKLVDNKIPVNAFNKNNKASMLLLTTIKLPRDLVSIGDSAFKDCTKLKDIIFPKQLSTIGEKAFNGCSNLTQFQVEYGSPYFSVNNGVLLNSNGTKLVLYPFGIKTDNYTLPETVTRIGKTAFRGCSNLSVINMPKNLVAIEANAFSDLPKLQSLILPDSLKFVDSGIIDGCNLLSRIISVCPTPPVVNGRLVFSGMSKDLLVKVPVGSVDVYKQAIGWKDFYNISDQPITKTVINNIAGALSNRITADEKTFIEKLVVTGSLNAADFTYINQLPKLTVVDMSGTTNTTSGSFNSNAKITSVVLPSTLVSIDNAAFSQCSKLSSIIIPPNVTSIGDYAFYNCAGLTSIVIPPLVTSIGSNAFYNCSGLTSIVLPSLVTSIGSNVFLGCPLLKSFTIPASVKTIGSNAFDHYVKKINVLSAIPATLSQSGVFSSINKNSCILQVPIGAKKAYQTASQWMDFKCIVEDGYTTSKIINTTAGNLRSSFSSSELIAIDNLVVTGTMDARDFRILRDSMPNLTMLDLGNVNILAYVGKEGTSSSFNDTIYEASSIPSNALSNKSTLNSIILPTTITKIKSAAFQNCTGLILIRIPFNVKSIDYFALSTNSLSSIYVYSMIPSTISLFDIWETLDLSNCILYVPIGSKPAYQSDSGWGQFKNIIEFDPTNLTQIELNQLKIYPTLVSDGFRLTGVEGVVFLSILDTNGKQIFSKNIDSKDYISMNGVEKGVYIVKIINAGKSIQVKIIKR